MTRSRATATGVPGPLAAEYYAQRASLGLLIAEGTQPSADGQGYLTTPGIHTPAQIEGWRRVSDAVHAAGGHLFLQVMHVGRISHPDNTPHGRQPVAPSAVTPQVEMFTAGGMRAIPEPRALATDEVAETVEDFRRAARAAVDAGADGVEIHGANGYLVQQFLSSSTNRRDDRYGGPVENRVRFGVEVAEAMAGEIGAERVGIRISPAGTFNDMAEEDTDALYDALLERLAPLGLAYLHLVHHRDAAALARVRDAWPGVLMVNRPGADLGVRFADVEEGRADLVSLASMALANPDLVARIRAGGPYNEADPATFYGGGAAGYTDYPTLDAG